MTTVDTNARAALLGAAHAAVAALKAFEAAMVTHEAAKVGEDIARPMAFLRGLVGSAIGTIEGRLPPVERTPEVVLRTMLRAYEAALLDASIRYERGEATFVDYDLALEAVLHLRMVIADLVAHGKRGSLGRLSGDYEARLRGDRPLDAPPMEVL